MLDLRSNLLNEMDMYRMMQFLRSRLPPNASAILGIFSSEHGTWGLTLPDLLQQWQLRYHNAHVAARLRNTVPQFMLLTPWKTDELLWCLRP